MAGLRYSAFLYNYRNKSLIPTSNGLNRLDTPEYVMLGPAQDRVEGSTVCGACKVAGLETRLV